MYFEDLLSADEKHLSFFPLAELTQRALASPHYVSRPHGGSLTVVNVTFDGRYYQLQVSMDPDLDELNGIFWVTAKVTDDFLEDDEEPWVSPAEVPLTRAAVVISIAKTFDLPLEAVMQGAVDTYSFRQGEGNIEPCDFPMCPPHLADKYRLVPRS